MKRFLIILFVSCVLLISFSTSQLAATDKKEIEYRAYQLPTAIVHTLEIPRTKELSVTVAVAPELMTVAEFAKQHPKAIAVLNGGFFDPKNQQTTSYVIKNGQIIADPRRNEDLMTNQSVGIYMGKILNRSEFRKYQCGNEIKYDLTGHRTPIPPDCIFLDALGGGPGLLPEFNGINEAFLAYQEDKLVRDAIGSHKANARTAIALTPTGDLIWLMVEQKSTSTENGGLSLPELANFVHSLGVTKAINLDGGSSSSLYWSGKEYYGKKLPGGKPVKRKVKSVLLVESVN